MQSNMSLKALPKRYRDLIANPYTTREQLAQIIKQDLGMGSVMSQSIYYHFDKSRGQA